MGALERLFGIVFGRGWGSVRSNLGIAVVSIALAFALWVFVSEEENPRRTDTFAGVIPVEVKNVPQGLAVASLSETGVSVTVRAPEDEWDNLTTESFEATVDLSSLSAREGSVTVLTSTRDREIEVVSVTPATVEVALEPVTTKVVPVRVKLVGAPPPGFEPAPAQVRTEQVTASGPESLINLVQEAVADVNLTGLRVSVAQLAPLVPRDGRGGDISNVVLDPATVEVEIPIVQRELSVPYVVTASLSGLPADGYNVGSIQTDPAFVVITGAIEVLQSITQLETDDIDISGATSDVERVVPLRLPGGARAEGVDEVTVRVTIKPAVGETVIGVVPSVLGVGPGLNASTSVSQVNVRVSGEQIVVNQLGPSNLNVMLDVSGLGAGAHEVPLSIEVPAGVQVVAIEPATATVVLTQS